jgi:hypothetical protein
MASGATWSNNEGRSVLINGTSGGGRLYAADAAGVKPNGNKITVAIKLRTLETPAQYNWIFGKTTDATWTSGFGLFYNSSTTVNWFTTAYTSAASATIVPGQNNILVGTQDGSAGLKLYLNGALAATNGSITTASSTGSASFEIGQYGTSQYNTNSLIDFCFIWNRALTADEVSLLSADPYALFRPNSRIRKSSTVTSSQTITGVARITASTSQTITGKGDILTSGSQTITGKANIASSIALVQSTNAAANSSSVTGTYGSATTAGNLLIATAYTNGTGSTLAISGWTAGPNLSYSGGAQQLALFYKVASGSETTVALTGGNTICRLHIAEFSGLANPVVTDGSNTNTASSSTTIATGNITTALPTDLLITAAGTSTGESGSQSWDSSFSTLQADSTSFRLFSGYRTVSATGTYGPTATIGTTATNCGALIMAFSANTVTTTPTPTVTPKPPLNYTYIPVAR